MNRKFKATCGFTLLEVLIALIFFSLIGVVLQDVTASSTSNVLKARANSYATWIAENKLTELRLEDGLPAPKQYKEDIEFGVDRWQVVTLVQTTENPDIHRVEVQVSIVEESFDEPRQIRSLTGFVGRY
jgi:general secretion pathway protein I